MTAKRPILFIDRDGTLIEEPHDFQVDTSDKLRLVPEVVPALLRLRDAGYDFIMITNQDGLGTEAFPQESFDGPHELLMHILSSQGITFKDVLIDVSLEADNLPTRKPGIGLVLELMKDRSVDWERSAMVGDRDTDRQFAENLGIRSFLLKTDAFQDQPEAVWDWPDIAHELVDRPRRARVVRSTKETKIEVNVDLDKVADAKVETGLGFFDHMLDQLGKHGGFALELTCHGDLHIDEHHTIEDSALALGQALKEALGDKRGIGRYGFTLPMDETLAVAALDFSGRPYLVFDCEFRRERVGDFPTELVEHFWRSLCETAGLNLNLKVTGDNDHHQIEAVFKAVARALRQAIRQDGNELPTTKGML